MSDLRVASIAGADGTSPATLVKQSAAKAWSNLNGTGTIALRDSFNVSSVTDNGTGSYTKNFANAFSSADYSAAPGVGIMSTIIGFGTLAAGSIGIECRNSAFSPSDPAQVHCIVQGDLA